MNYLEIIAQLRALTDEIWMTSDWHKKKALTCRFFAIIIHLNNFFRKFTKFRKVALSKADEVEQDGINRCLLDRARMAYAGKLQCRATATSTGNRCRKFATNGVLCHVHVQRSPALFRLLLPNLPAVLCRICVAYSCDVYSEAEIAECRLLLDLAAEEFPA